MLEFRLNVTQSVLKAPTMAVQLLKNMKMHVAVVFVSRVIEYQPHSSAFFPGSINLPEEQTRRNKTRK